MNITKDFISAAKNGFVTLETGLGKHCIKIDFKSSDEVWDTYEALLKLLGYNEEAEE